MLIMMSSLSLEISLAWSTILSIISITALIGLCFICFDLFICSLISNPLLALVTCFLGNLLWMLLEWLNPFPLSFYYLAKELSLLSHSYHFLNGIFYSPDLIFYLVFSGFWLFMSQRILKSKIRHLA
jgi:ABC-2 type transport system permease protein